MSRQLSNLAHICANNVEKIHPSDCKARSNFMFTIKCEVSKVFLYLAFVFANKIYTS